MLVTQMLIKIIHQNLFQNVHIFLQNICFLCFQFSINFKFFKQFFFIEIHKTFEKFILLDLYWDLYKWVHFLNTTLLQVRPLKVCFQCKFVFKSVGFIWICSNLSCFIIKYKEEAGINVILIKIDAFKFIPEISLIAYKIPPKFLLIEIKVKKMFVISSLNSFEILFSLHLLFFRERKYISNFSFIIIQSTVQLSTGIFIFELISMSQDLNMNNWANIDFFEFKIESHNVNQVEIISINQGDIWQCKMNSFLIFFFQFIQNRTLFNYLIHKQFLKEFKALKSFLFFEPKVFYFLRYFSIF